MNKKRNPETSIESKKKISSFLLKEAPVRMSRRIFLSVDTETL